MKDLLKVGTAKYPITLKLPLFSLVLAIIITLSIAITFYMDSSQLLSKQKLTQLEKEADFIEHLIQEIYIKGEASLLFLSRTPPIQNIAKSIEDGDSLSDDIWRKRLQTIFSSLLESDKDYESIRLIQFNSHFKDNQKVEKEIVDRELVKSYRIEGRHYEAESGQLKTEINDYLKKHRNDAVGKVSFYNASVLEEIPTSDSILSLVTPIYSKQSGNFFGLLELKVNLNHFIDSLELKSLVNSVLYIANKEGKIIYEINHNPNKNGIVAKGANLKNISSKLSEIIDSKRSESSFFDAPFFENSDSEQLISGHYREMRLQKSDHNNLLRLFIELDTKTLILQLEKYRDRGLLLGSVLALIVLVFSVYASRKTTESIQTISSELLRYDLTGNIESLPINATDEIGVFARSFYNMVLTQKEKDKEIFQKQFALDEHAIVSITDVKGDITYVNEKFCAISGFSAEELIGQNHRLLNSGYHETTFFKEMYQTLITGNTFSEEICNKAKSGKIYWVQTTIVPMMNDQGKPESYVSIRTDITQSKMDALEIAETRDILSFQVEQLREANADLDQFAYVASHDLKSPLNGINQLVNWIEEDCNDILPKESKEHLNLLKSRSRRMLKLLNDLLEYSRIGRDEHAKENLNLKDMTEELFELQGHREGFSCEGQDVDFNLQRIPFEMVLRNLISNAIKHHDKNEGNIKVSYEKITKNDRDLHQFKIVDDGPGIPPDLQEKALEMFQTLQSRDKTEGSGMGLAMVKKMAEKYEGSLQIESDGVRGTTFIVQWGV